MSAHVIRYDGVDYKVTPGILSDVFRGVSRAAGRANGPAFVQRLDEIQDGTSVILVFGLGTGLTFTTTTALAASPSTTNGIDERSGDGIAKRTAIVSNTWTTCPAVRSQTTARKACPRS